MPSLDQEARVPLHGSWSLNVAMTEYPYLANVRFPVSVPVTP